MGEVGRTPTKRPVALVSTISLRCELRYLPRGTMFKRGSALGFLFEHLADGVVVWIGDSEAFLAPTTLVDVTVGNAAAGGH